ncbi:D-glycero-D-manno-heptose 1,7-bisphosphate phosphatase [Desulfonatronum thiosulfatophilum]|uniref:D,D-heptose 1,7-bisphosphate phosphatase n=1 Tax=Desulfonatronum thiosulfatophilum TaxID=617002 RepID=A0A1G6A000_9BACT|nr:HAD family hydrolase [Desulfonatronum thiosulfatophilum]SDB01725.1 D-glycero-D-manno-heptose 1,7-bisphosphate phosphatase [Desulfonatronum thiosulfatophilum]
MIKNPMNILLDRDGTVIEECHYLCDPEHVRLTPGAGAALRSLVKAGHRLFLVTNQSGIGRGYFSREQYDAVQERIGEVLRDFDVEFTDTVLCPHAPQDDCQCRKPLPGLWEQLRDKYDLLPETSMMIGDKHADICFARAGNLAAAVLVLSGYGLKTAQDLDLVVPSGRILDLRPPVNPNHPDIVAPDLAAAAAWILGE